MRDLKKRIEKIEKRFSKKSDEPRVFLMQAVSRDENYNMVIESPTEPIEQNPHYIEQLKKGQDVILVYPDSFYEKKQEETK